MRVLIACEFSGTVRDAFAARGHDAWSCDTLPSETSGQHYQGDARDFVDAGWDLLICHPPCTHLAISGARWFKDKKDEQAHGLGFVMQLWAAPIDRIALENPISILSSRWRKPDQIIQPWMFSHGEVKATCLWLRGLPKLIPTDIVEGREPRVHFMPPSEDRWKERSRTLSGIAEAMANQWGNLNAVKKTRPKKDSAKHNHPSGGSGGASGIPASLGEASGVRAHAQSDLALVDHQRGSADQVI